jgi:hypothetical protein
MTATLNFVLKKIPREWYYANDSLTTTIMYLAKRTALGKQEIQLLKDSGAQIVITTVGDSVKGSAV